MTDSKPWLNEPNHLEFRHKGYPCIIHRNDSGALCGYAGVSPGHPYHGKHYDDADIDVHGGLTYANACRGPICHVPREGESDDVWWLGFDCAHSGDLSPFLTDLREADKSLREIEAKYPDSYHRWKETYKTIDYVKDEIRSMVDQLIAVEK